MTSSSLTDAVLRRADVAGLQVQSGLAAGLAAYYSELCRWNQAINLTALRLEPEGTDQSIDKLLLEPVAAAPYLPAGEGPLLDIGSGGGSPAIPLKLARPALELWMVEARQRKAIFLRQMVRHLELDRVVVEQAWLEDLTRREELQHRFAATSVRAVRLDHELAQCMLALLAPSGSVLYFASEHAPPADIPPFTQVLHVPLIAETNSRLRVFKIGT